MARKAIKPDNIVKKLTKKLKDFKVEITFAESKEYNVVKENLMESANDIAATNNPISRRLAKQRKRHGPSGGKKNRTNG